MEGNQQDLYSRYFPKKFSWGNKRTRIIILASILPATLIIGFWALYFAVLLGFFGDLPEQNELAAIQNPVASEVFSADGKLIGKYFVENRTNVTYKDISPQLVQALIATEDARFYDHAGVDNRSMMRVLVKSVILQDKSAGGGSTITQQLAKNLYPRQDYSILTMPVSKIREAVIARRLEKIYSKEEIITLYLNTVSFGESVYGIDVATERFFNTDPKNIKLEDAAVLVGMLKANTAYNPRRYPEKSQERRNVVLDQMVKYGYLSSEEADSLKKLPLKLDYRNITREDGPAPYFLQEAGLELKEWFLDNPGPDGKIYNLYTDGLKIHTTIDSRLQSYAEKAVKQHMKQLQKTFNQHWKNRKIWDEKDSGIVRAMKQSDRYKSLKTAGLSEEQILENFHQPVKMKIWSWEGEEEREMTPMDSIVYYQSFLQAGFLAMEPKTGYIRAWVGGYNHQQFKYDHVTSHRQVGSTFKPVVYAAALENGLEPCKFLPNEKVSYGSYKNWSPGNSDGKYGGFYSVMGGLTHSVNTVSAAIIMEMGVDKAYNFAKNFRFSGEIPRDPTLVLGTADLSLMDMAGAYSAFANQGKRAVPVYITRIEDAEGNVIAEFPFGKPDNFRVMTEMTAGLMTKMLISVVDSGTAQRLRYTYNLKGEIGGKTGTTQDQTDGWFMGITPGIVAGAWVGGEDRKVRFRSTSLGQGAATALPIYGLFMQQYYADSRFRKTQSDVFPTPGLSAMQSLDCNLYSEYNPEETAPDILELIKMLRKRQEEKGEWQETQQEDKLREKLDRKRERKDKWDQLLKRKNP
ncbi:MAG: transglycosylase domain-containing protein [Bacteroidia bacterium]|nr:transglycosylase domain-containing protein [Bacteroidia bacterium]